jgi:hypothetical protein
MWGAHGVSSPQDATLSRSKLAQLERLTTDQILAIGRSALIAAGILIEEGMRPEEAIARVSAARNVPVPETPDQRTWINSFATKVEEKR